MKIEIEISEEMKEKINKLIKIGRCSSEKDFIEEAVEKYMEVLDRAIIYPLTEEVIERPEVPFGVVLLIKDWRHVGGGEIYSYLGKPVLEIQRNWVIFVYQESATIPGPIKGQDYQFLPGVGMYSIKFSHHKPNMYITVSREINGMILSPKTLDALYNCEKIFKSTTSKLRATECVAEIPFEIIDHPLYLQSYERGVLAVRILTPYKDAFDMLHESSVSDAAYPAHEGPKILSLHPDVNFWNKIVTSENIGEDYKQSIPGIEISQNLNELIQLFIESGGLFLEDGRLLLSSKEIIDYIMEKTKEAKEIYKDLGDIIIRKWEKIDKRL